MLEAAHALMQADGVRPGELERIVVGVGPGGFTGLRIGIASALGLAQALGIPCVGASSLEALALSIAEAAPTADVVVPVLDARRGEVFTAAYRVRPGSDLDELIAPSALAPEALEARVGALVGSQSVVGGSGLVALAGALQRSERVLGDGPHSSPRAANLAKLASAGRVLPVVPVYARLPDAERTRRERAT